MFFTKAAVKATAFLSILGLVSAADLSLCANGPFKATEMHGPLQEDLSFCDTKWNIGVSVTGIQMWATLGHIKAFQLSFSDGTRGPVHGDNTDTEGNNGNWYGQGQLSWGEGELITALNLAPNYWGNGDRFGGMTMSVGEKKFECKSDIGSYGGVPQDFASGLLIGAFGSSGADVNSLGFMFLSGSAGTAKIVDMKFPDTLEDMNEQQKGITSFNLKAGQFKNSSPEGSGNGTFTFASVSSEQKSRTITNSRSHAFGVSISQSISAKVSVPELVEITAETSTTASYEYTDITTTSEMTMEADQTTFSQSGNLAPGWGAECSAKTLKGEYATDYTNVIEITTAENQKFTIEQPAHFKSVGFTQAVVECAVKPIRDLPGGGSTAEEIGDTTSTRKRAISFTA